ncbi:CU044_5270 family protein [Amycolatopsis sp. NPDC004747]
MREDNVRKIWSEAELDAALTDLHGDVEEEDEGLAFARASLLAAAGVEEAPPAEPRRAGAWRWLAVAAAVVTLVGGLGVAAAVWTPDAPEPSRPAVSLPDLDRPLTPGEFRYAQKLTWVPEVVYGLPAWAQQKVELWIPADPTGTWHRRTRWTGVVQGLGPAQQKDVQVNLTPKDEFAQGGAFPADGRSDVVQPHWSPSQQKWLQPDAAFVASLAHDQVALRKRLMFDTAGSGGNIRVYTPTESLAMVRSVLELGLAPKDIRFALAEALGGVPSAYVASGHTPDGRSAMVLGVKDSGQRLYLDPSTAQLLAWEAAQPVPAVTRSNEPPLTTGYPAPRSTPVSPQTTTRQKPDPAGPVTVYSFAITQTSG